MLTTWKHTRTSIEYTPPPNNKVMEESANFPVSPGVIIGAQLVHPMARHDPFCQDRTNTSLPNRGKKKRRKFNSDHAAAGVIPLGMEIEPIICLTFPHRVVFMGTGVSGTSSTDCNLVEGKSRSYVTRPGPGSRFSLCGNTRQYTTDRITFAGMLSPGAQYDPASNLIYAIRNGGTEVAIWTATPSSTLPGPDDKVSEGVINGRNIDLVGGKEEDHNTMMMSKKTRKRQLMRQQHDSNLEFGSSKDSIISQRLKIPGGIFALTLTPFSILQSLSSKGQGMLAAVGAAGCCEDGSIWVAVCFPPNRQFQLLIVEGSSMDIATSVVNSGKGQKTSAKAHILLDSRVTGKVSYRVSSGDKDNKPSVLLSIQSVLLSRDKKSQVVFRSHQVRIHSKESSDRQLSVLVERYTMQDILQLESSKSDIAVELDMDTDSLSIIHRNIGDRWMFTLVKLSLSEGALVNLMRTFPLPSDGMNNATNLFSFGKVGPNIVAVLLKSQSTKKREDGLLSLRIIDFHRMAELAALHWIEGDDAEIKEPTFFSKDNNIMNEVLQGKQCHAMITNELDGSIALLTSSKEAEGSLDIVFSKLEMNLIMTSNVSMTSRSTPLAFAMNSKAGLVSNLIETISSNVYKARPNSNFAEVVSSEAIKVNARESVVDDAVDKVCELLTTSSKHFIDHTVGKSDTGTGSTTNGTSLKGSKVRKQIGCSISWREVYQECRLLIVKAKEGHLNRNSLMRDGLKAGTNTLTEFKSVTTGELPKRFIEAVFKETATILLLLNKEAAPMRAQKSFRKSIQEATSVLVEVLQTNLISAREDYCVGFLHHGHVLLLILQACSSISLSEIGVGMVGKLHVIDAMLEHVRDIPEGALVSFLRFILINVEAEDAVAFYSTSQQTSGKSTSLSNQYKELSADQNDGHTHIGTRLLAEVLLDFTSKIVTYSSCNHFFLTKAVLANVNASGEVESILLILAKLLKLSTTCKVWKGNNESTKNHHSNHACLALGTIHWISALTYAHMDMILETINEGGFVIDRVKSAIHAAVVQSEFASDIRDISDRIMFGEVVSVVPKSSTVQSRTHDIVIAAYSIERLVF